MDDETVIRMVGKGLGISMMSELMIRGNTEDVYCVPVSPTCIREIGMGMKPGTEENGSIAKLRECVMQFVSTLNKGGKRLFEITGITDQTVPALPFSQYRVYN